MARAGDEGLNPRRKRPLPIAKITSADIDVSRRRSSFPKHQRDHDADRDQHRGEQLPGIVRIKAEICGPQLRAETPA